MSTCYIVGAGDFTTRDFAPLPQDFVIAADAGYLHLRKLGMQPQLLLGDFDSLGEPTNIPDGMLLDRFPARKNDTDTGLALSKGWERGHRAFALYGGGGGRLDHLLANIQSLCRYSRLGGQMRLVDPHYDLFALTNGTLTLPLRPAGTLVSVFCHGEAARGVTLRGLSYPLTDATLTCDYPLGVSNQVLESGRAAEVTAADGTVVVMVYLNANENG